MSRPSIDRDQSPTVPTEGFEEADGTRAPSLLLQKDGVDTSAAPLNLPADQDLFDTSRPPTAPKSQSERHGAPVPLPANPNPSVEQQAEEEEEEDDNVDDGEDHPPPHPAPKPADFKPFFTLIADARTGEHHHPHVHYLFADDAVDEEGSSGEALTAAALDALQPGEDGEEEQRVIIVDVAPDGKGVRDVVSLSPAFQALRTEVGPAPSMGGEREAEGGGLMLRILGQEGGGGGGGCREDEDVGLEGLVARFGEVVSEVGDVVGGKAEEVSGEEGKMTGGA